MNYHQNIVETVRDISTSAIEDCEAQGISPAPVMAEIVVGITDCLALITVPYTNSQKAAIISALVDRMAEEAHRYEAFNAKEEAASVIARASE